MIRWVNTGSSSEGLVGVGVGAGMFGNDAAGGGGSGETVHGQCCPYCDRSAVGIQNGDASVENTGWNWQTPARDRSSSR